MCVLVCIIVLFGLALISIRNDKRREERNDELTQLRLELNRYKCAESAADAVYKANQLMLLRDQLESLDAQLDALHAIQRRYKLTRNSTNKELKEYASVQRSISVVLGRRAETQKRIDKLDRL